MSFFGTLHVCCVALDDRIWTLWVGLRRCWCLITWYLYCFYWKAWF